MPPRHVRLCHYLSQGFFFVIPIDDHASPLLSQHHVHEDFLWRLGAHLGHLGHEPAVDLGICHAESHVMPADVCQVGWLGNEVGSNAPTLLGIAESGQHRLAAPFLAPTRVCRTRVR